MKPTKFEIFIFIAMLVAMVLIICSGCVVSKSVDSDLCDHVLYKKCDSNLYAGKCVKCGTDIIDPFTYSNNIVEPEFEENGLYPKGEWTICGHIFVQIYNSIDCVCIKCDTVEQCDHQYGIFDPPTKVILTPSHSDSCQHALMMTTLLWCDPPSNQCNTSTCMGCGYSYKCN